MDQKDIIEAISNWSALIENMDANHPILQQNAYKNQWFTVDNQLFALNNWKSELTNEQLSLFAQKYQYSKTAKTVGIVMAGNVPLVGLHDLICVLLSGHVAQVKLSKDDELLMRFFIDSLITQFPSIKERIQIVDKLVDYHAAIATGSNNTSRYFEYYFRGVPSIIRKNRTSIAIIDNQTSDKHLMALSEDIFRYFGLGCRNVGKIYIPEGYDIPKILDQWNHWFFLADHNKYFNNYTYHKALFLMNLEHHFDNGFLTLKESSNLFSPLGCLFFETYNNHNQLKEHIESNSHEIQCIVGNGDFLKAMIPFGNAQKTQLNDFADGIDTMKFLESI